MSANSNRGRRVERLLARVGALALAVGFVGALLALDVALAPPADGEQTAAAGTWSLRLVAHDGRALWGFPEGTELTLSPLLHFEHRPAPGGGEQYGINSLGLRGPELALPGETPAGAQHDTMPDAATTVRPVAAIVGGSAVFGMFVPDEMPFCRLLADRFADIDVVNGGAIGYLSGQETAPVALKLLDYRPQLVIACDGWNDCYDGILWHQATGQEHAVRGVNSSFQIMENRLADYRAIQTRPAAAGGAWARVCLGRSRLCGWLARHGESQSTPAEYPAALIDRAVETYVENMLRMRRLVQGQGGRFVVALQPAAGQFPGILPDHPLAQRLSSEHYTAFRRQSTQRLQAADVELIDLSEKLAERNRPSHEMLLDLVHLTPSGHTHVANLLEPYLQDLRRETVRGG